MKNLIALGGILSCFKCVVFVVLAFCLGLAEPLLAQELDALHVEAVNDTTSDQVEEGGAVPLTFEVILHQAMENNPDIDMAEARLDQASELLRQNGAYRYPRVELSAGIGPENNRPVETTDSGEVTSSGRNIKLTVTQHLYDGGTSRSEFERSKRLESAAQAEAKIVMEELFLDVSRFYIDYWRYQFELSEAEAFVDTMTTLVGDLDSMYRAGAASKLEVDFARARLASAQGVESSAAESRNNAFSELEYLVPGLQGFIAISPEQFSEFTLQPLLTYIDQGVATNSGFLTNKLSREATEFRVSSHRGRYKPSLDLEVSGSVIEDEGGPSERRDKLAAKLLLNYTLYSGGDRKGAVRRAQAQLRELEAERVKLERDVFRSIDQSYNSITSARLSLDAVMNEIDAHQELQRLNRENLKLGTINIIELIDVEERLFNAESRKGEVIATMYQEYLDLMVSAGYTAEVLEKYSLRVPEN